MQIRATYREIWNIAFPVMLGSMAQSINQMIDTAFLGRVGIVELGAGNLGGLFFLLLMLVGAGFTKGAQILIARKSGEMNYTGIGEVFDHLVYKAAALAIFLFLSCYYIIPQLTPWLIASPGISEKSVDFLQARSWGVFPGMICLTMSAFYTGIGRTKVISISTIVQAGSNIFLDWLMIFGHWGLPAMGIKGAAYATDIAEVLGVMVYMGALVKSGYIKQFSMFKWVGMQWALIKEMLHLSIPLVIQTLFGLGSWQAFFLLIEKMGDRELAISSMMKSLYIFMGIPAWGLASTANTVVSNLVGQGKFSEIPNAIKKTVHISFIFAAALCAFIILLPQLTMSIYTDDPALIADSMSTLWVLLPALIFFSVAVILLQSIMGMGNTKVTMVIEFTCIALYMLHVVATTIVWPSQLYFVWMSEWTYWIPMIVLSLFYFKVKKLTFQDQ